MKVNKKKIEIKKVNKNKLKLFNYVYQKICKQNI